MASDRREWCPAHFIFVWWVPNDDLPLDDGYVQMYTRKYRDWQLLVFAAATDGQLSDKERLLYEEGLAQQPPAVEGRRRDRKWGDRRSPVDQADSSISEEVNASRCPLDAGEHEDPLHDKHRAWEPGENRSANEGINATGQPEYQVDEVGPPQWLEVLGQHATGMRALSARPELFRGTFFDGMGGVTEPVYVTVAYLQEMDDEITDSTPDKPLADLHLRYAASAGALMDDMDGGNEDEFENALPPPAYGVVCDIDVRGHASEAESPANSEYLRKLYELLEGLLEAGLIAFSSSPWASPIVIVLKKNGQDIRLCIDYKMVNAITLIIEYAMPLVDDLLTEMETTYGSVLSTLQAASGGS
ncbi:unnamed protein product [Phytophthora fragariaefolia]|uniref:Unnamed protein product n=1 Tax=Phytophthora fragariaefolia TaxID=1490495 RepID=A0A9W6UCE5_9STRA|nr:unnamed protein product [Phytophthora fragariaefolia]